MTNCTRLGLLGAIAGFLFGAMAANVARAEKIDTDALEQAVSRNDSCRVIVIRVDTGMTRLTFENKAEAQAAVDMMWKQAHEQATGASNSFEFLSPDCPLDVEAGK